MSDSRARVVEAYERLGGNVSAVARELGVVRSTVRFHVKKAGLDKNKPLVGGTVVGMTARRCELPGQGKVRRFILTSAQNNTHVHKKAWANLLALAKHYKAELLVGTFSYNKNAYGQMSVKRGTADHDSKLWYAPELEPYICDERVQLAPGLVWCGEMNIQPTAVDPLTGLETYSGRDSSIFPQAKHAMRSIAAMRDEPVKFNYTTGTVTVKNYIQKKAGLVAEHHHSYGGLIVEVDSKGQWFVRQLDADEKGDIYDLDRIACEGSVHTGVEVEAITWGDIHAACVDKTVLAAALGKGGMLKTLKPRYQFLHDIMEGITTNHWTAKDPHQRFADAVRGYHCLVQELEDTADVLKSFLRTGTQTLVVDANHDGMRIMRWLREHDYRKDPTNAVIFLALQLAVYRALAEGKSLNLTEHTMEACGVEGVTFLNTDDSFKICDDRIECAMHGHLGPNGARGTPQNLNKVGRRANTGHTHTAGIYNGLYVAGTSTLLTLDYTKGPSSWSHTHVVTYPNGRRTLVTMRQGKWRA